MISSLKPFLVVVDREIAFLDKAKKFLEREFLEYPILIDPGPIDAIHTALTAVTGKAIFILGHDLGDMTGIAVAKVLKENFRYDAYYVLLTPNDDHELFAKAYEADLHPFAKEPPDGGEPYNLGRLFKAFVLHAERELNRDTTDLLTGAYTRRQALEIWRKDFVQAKKNRTTTGYVYVDVNYFGAINKVLGDHEGDILLARFADCLRRGALSADDIICRQGGDEFLVILMNTSRAAVLRFIRNVEEFATEIVISYGGMSMSLSAAFGYVVIPYNKLHKNDAHQTLKGGATVAARQMRADKVRKHASIMRGPCATLVSLLIQKAKEMEVGL